MTSHQKKEQRGRLDPKLLRKGDTKLGGRSVQPMTEMKIGVVKNTPDERGEDKEPDLRPKEIQNSPTATT